MKVVKITWIDSCSSDSSWTMAEDANTGIIQIETYGIVIKETDEFISIAQNYGSEPEQFCNIMTIPKGCIKEIIIIPNMVVKEKNNSDEDEVIRKELIYLVEGYWQGKGECLIENSTVYNRMLAYLEKQGEQKSYAELPQTPHKYNNGDWIVSKYGGIYQVKEVMRDSYNILCTNNTEEINSIFIVDNASRLLCMKDIQKLEQQSEQKTWSKEDESFINDMLDYFGKLEPLKHEMDNVVDWLESLKERYTLNY